ncbi:hypothetical protein CF111_16030 [Aeromonas sobria]|uniref:hypothetical protein n=1 Tax=Aeromonas sobria TaxID=646 RepID=UPI00111B7BB4|nr:hypothetical protein [Aeromonas sobria]TNJ19611.1 hypothetical protein CF111_16030 [Aeromonas sobria]
MERDKLIDVNFEVDKTYAPIFEQVFSDKFTSRKDDEKRVWYFESNSYSFGVCSTFTQGKSLEQIKNELMDGLKNGLYQKGIINKL